MTPVQQVPGPYEDTTCQMVAAYGTPDHAHLTMIRRFRDTVLRALPLGPTLIELYYKTSPVFIAAAVRSSTARTMIRYGMALPAYTIARTVLGLRAQFT